MLTRGCAVGAVRRQRRAAATPAASTVARRFQAGSRVAGHLAPGDFGGARRRDVRSGHHPARQRAGRVPAKLHAIRRPHDRRRAAIRTGSSSSRPTQRCCRASSSGPACRRPWWSRCGDWKATTAPTRAASTTSSARSRRWPMTAGARSSSASSSWARCASSSAATSRPREMIGNWAGELGPTQFTPGGLFQARRRFRRRRPRRHDPQRARRARLRRQSDEELRLAERPALAAGGARARPDAVAGVRPRQPASALAMGEVGRHRRAWPASRRQSAGVADPADGPPRPGVPRLSEFQGLHRMERRASSIRRPRPISARGLPARRRSGRATASRWCRPPSRSRSCSGC